MGCVRNDKWQLILRMGNFVNSGTFRGSAAGFKVDILGNVSIWHKIVLVADEPSSEPISYGTWDQRETRNSILWSIYGT